MFRTSLEIKARIEEHSLVREKLKSDSADIKGTDKQVDTYFKVNNGRLKLREGNIENFLIHYLREND